MVILGEGLIEFERLFQLILESTPVGNISMEASLVADLEEKTEAMTGVLYSRMLI